MTRKPTAPEYVVQGRGITTQREWRRLKRADLKNLLKQLRELRLGSAYCPEPRKVVDLLTLAEDLQRAWSPKEWGR